MEKKEIYHMYVASDNKEKINLLAENGWEVLSMNPFIIGVPFKMPKDAKITDQFKKWVSIQTDEKHDPKGKIRKKLEKDGFLFEKVYSDQGKTFHYSVNPESEPFYEWAFVIDYSTSPAFASIMFGKGDMRKFNFYDREVIKRNAPSDIISYAVEKGAIEDRDLTEDDLK